MSHDLSGNSSLTRNSSIDQEKSTLHIENSELNSDDTESLVRLGALYRLHSSTGERTITAGAIIPTRKHNLAELQAANSSLDKGYYNAGSRAQTVPLSYNLRNAPREGQDSPILIPQYLPSPSSSISTPSYPNYMSISTSSSFKQASTSTYSPRTRPSNDAFAQATKNSHTVNEIRGQNDLRQIYQSDIHNQHTNQQTSHGLINRGTTGTVIPETDILYSSSDEDDAVQAYGEEKYGSDLALDHEKEEEAEVSSSEDIDDPEYLELCERGEIVEKYDKGPDSKDVDPWENPDFELYKVTDRYGFIHKNSPPADAGKDAKERERKRDQKWYRMVLEWNKRFPVKLKERIWKGVPDKLRSDVWQRLLGSKELKLAAGTNTYRELLMRAKLISKDIKQIDLDINRTYRDNLAFRRRYDVKQRSLFNVLSAYAMYNTEVGYCQGMSQIAALFLLYMDEEEAFWCLHSLMVGKKFTMHGFFVPGFPKLHRFQDHYEKILQKYLPRLKKHFDKFGIPPIYLTKWWFGCFLDRVPFSLALRIWDIFIFQGDSILLAMSYNIMKMHQKTIRKFQMENFMEFIQNGIAQDFGYPSDKVMESLEECLRRLQSDKMDQPPPPPPGAPSEVPTKPLGPVLSRSMINIEMDIAEIQSRCSRANSLAGTPSMSRHQHSKKSAVRTQKMAHSLHSTIEHRLENIHGRNNEWHVNSKKSPSTELGYDKVLSNVNNMHIVPSHSKKPHEFGENFNRQKDTTTTTTDNRRSYYDNVPTPSMSIPDDESQVMFPRIQRPAEGSSFHGNVGIEPIHRTPIKYTNQNITYIAVGDDDHAVMPPSYQEVIRGNHSSSVYVSDSRSTSFSQSMQPNRKNYEQIERL